MPRNFSRHGGPYFINNGVSHHIEDKIKKVSSISRAFKWVKDEIYFHRFMWGIKKIPKK
jgi:hypothetical protein